MAKHIIVTLTLSISLVATALGRPVLMGGAATGGDEMGSRIHHSGYSESVFAGSGVSLGLGWQFESPQKIGLQTNVRYFYDLADTDSGDLLFHRFPLDVLTYARFGLHRFATGVTLHLHPSLNGRHRTEYQHASGIIFMWGVQTPRGPELGVRVTQIRYFPTGLHDNEGAQAVGINGSSVGVFGSISF